MSGILLPPDQLREAQKALDRDASRSGAASSSARSRLFSVAGIIGLVVAVGLGTFFLLRRTQPSGQVDDGVSNTLLSAGSSDAQGEGVGVPESSDSSESEEEPLNLEAFNERVSAFGEAFSPSSDDDEDADDSAASLASQDDTDNDGLSDAREVQLGTDPQRSDTDADGFSDGEEVKAGYNPLGPGRFDAQARVYDDAESGLSFSISSDHAFSAPVLLDHVISTSGEVTYPTLKVLPLDVLTNEASEFGTLPLEEWQTARTTLDSSASALTDEQRRQIRSVLPIYGDFVRGEGTQPAFLEDASRVLASGVHAYESWYALPEGDPQPTLVHVTAFVETDQHAVLFLSWYRGKTLAPETLLAQLRDGAAEEALQQQWQLHQGVIDTVSIKRAVLAPVNEEGDADTVIESE